MSVIIGNARISEYGTVNGAKGDQTGREVMTQAWSTGGTWQYVIRPKDEDAAKKIAAAMVAACNNNNIGYSQSDRLSLYNIVSKNGWKIASAGKCNCDCSSLVAVCCNVAGIKVAPTMYTGNELAVLKATGKFIVYTATSYTKSQNNLRTGDILLRAGHTAIVTSGVVPFSSSAKTPASKSSSKSSATKTPSSSAVSKLSKTPKWVGKVTAAKLNVRTWAGTEYSNLKSYPYLGKNNKVDICDTVKASNGKKWYYIRIANKYYGFVSSEYIKKV